MGVHGLWKLLEPSGKPVPVETLENHVLAVDVSIWLHQLLQGYRDGGGSSLPNAHLLGLFQRVCKLLFFRIKPVFVFDGGVPSLKKKTIATRHQQKDRATIASEKARQQLLKNLLKQRAVSQVLGELKAIPSTSTSQQKKDLYELPPILDEDDNSDIESIHSNSSESEDDHIKKKKYKDLHSIDVHSSDFKALPADIRHDILTELKDKRKENSWGRIHEMPEDLGQFSNFQMNRLLKRRSVQVSLEEAEKEMGGRTFSLGDVEALLIEQGIQTSDVGNRIASDNVTRFLYVTDSVKGSRKTVDTSVPKKEIDSVQPKEVDVVDSCSKDTLGGIEDCKGSVNELSTQLDETCESTKKEPLNSIKEESTESQIFNEINLEENSNSSDEITFEDLNEEFEMNRKLIIENSGLTQDQILTIIKEQNKKSSGSISKICKTSIINVEENESVDKFLENDTGSNINDRTSCKESNIQKISDKSIILPEIDTKNLEDTNLNVLANQNIINHPEYEVNSSKLIDPNYSETDEKSTLSNLSNTKGKEIVSKSKVEVVNNLNDNDNLKSVSPRTCSVSNNDADESIIEVTQPPKKSDSKCEIKPTNSTVVQVTINTKSNNDNNDEDIFADIFDDVSKDSKVLDSSVVPKLDQSNDVEIMGSSDTSSSETEEEVKVNGSINNNEGNASAAVEKYSDVKHDSPEIGNNLSKLDNKDEMNLDLTNVKEKDEPATAPLNDSLLKDNMNPDEAEEINEESPKKPSKKLTTKELSKLQTVLENQEEQLVQKQGKEERLASTVTEQMRLEAQELLQLFGVPWVIAPMEAEAQCAFLDCTGLTQGTITDDSDVWLFGARKVYKNFFNQKKYVLQFQAQDIQHYFKLSRGDLIELALLVGSDYTSGVTGVGPVTALEILAMFRPLTSNDSSILTTLTAFKNWLQHPSNSSSQLASKLKDVQLEEGFPSKEVVEAYLHPMVDESEESFSWGFPDLDGLREFTKRKFGWSQTRTDELLLPVIKNLSQKTSQTKIDSYFQFKPSIPVYKDKVSQRVQKAIYRLGGDSSSVSGQFESRAGSSGTNQRQRKNRSGLPNRRTSGRGTVLQIEPTPPAKPPPLPTNELIPQRERDRLEALKRKMEAIEVLKAKGNKKVKRPPRAPIKKEANLSESSSDEN